MRENKTVILHMIETTGHGGAETVFANTVKSLDPDEFIPIVLLTGKGWLFDTINAAGISPVVIKSSGPYDWRFVWKIVRLIKSEKVDLIHSHLDDTNFYACLSSIFSNTPVVATYHGMVGTWQTRNLKSLIKMSIIKHRAKYVVAVSDFLKKELLQAGAFRLEQMRRIYNGVDFASFDQEIDLATLREEFKIPSSVILVGAVGNIRKWKGYDYLVKAARMIIEKAPDTLFLIVGQGEQRLLDDLKALISSLGLSDKIMFTGHRNNVPQIMRLFDVFVLPSITEGLSIATIEAMGQGLPVVVTDCGGPAEIVEDGKTGFLVPPKDAEALAQRILQLIIDRTLAASLGKNAKTKVRAQFDLKHNISNYVELYKGCTS